MWPPVSVSAVVNTAVPFQRGVASQMPEPPDAALLMQMQQSLGDAPNADSNSAVVHSWTCPAESMALRPRYPRLIWDTESRYGSQSIARE